MTWRERLWSKVAIGDSEECWPWLAQIDNCGYGRIKIDGQPLKAHRMVYIDAIGPIPAGWTIDHQCHNTHASCHGGNQCRHRRCCNPSHLEAVPNKINLLRGRTLPALNAIKTHCPQGHPYDETNTRLEARGAGVLRHCRICKREQERARYRLKQLTEQR